MKSLKKKFCYALLFTGFAFALFAFAGCQGQQNSANTQMNQPLDRRIGIIKSLGGVKTSNKGTHLLQQDDGSTILLKSLMINMDEPQYLNKNVEVRGIITYTTDQKQIMEVENIDFVEGGISQESSLPQWKEYASGVMGLSMKYKDDLKLSEGDGTVSFERNVESKIDSDVNATSEATGSKPVTHQLLIEKKAFASTSSLLSDLGVKSDSYNDLMAKGMVKSIIGSESYSAIKKTENSLTKYYIEGSQALYVITIDCGQDEQTLSDQNLFYEMLGTFKINFGASKKESGTEDDVSNNTPLGFEVDENVNSQQSVSQPVSTTQIEPAEDSSSETLEETLTEETTETIGVDTPLTQEAISGYETMASGSFKFSVQYPKSWFYAGSAGASSDVIRHYEFGSKPIEETPGQVALDLVSGSLPAGESVTAGINTVVKKESGGSVELYIDGAGGRVYKITGPSSMESTLLNIAGSLQEQ
jgi:hypothetical protein